MKQTKQIVKRTLDLAMIVLLPLLMAEILIGQELHEWLGTVMTVLFVLHHLLNLGWWGSFYKGNTPRPAHSAQLSICSCCSICLRSLSAAS